LKWSTNNFGMGGIILVNTNLVGLTEDGQLILMRPNPNAYTELARYRAFQFSATPTASAGAVRLTATDASTCAAHGAASA